MQEFTWNHKYIERKYYSELKYKKWCALNNANHPAFSSWNTAYSSDSTVATNPFWLAHNSIIFYLWFPNVYVILFKSLGKKKGSVWLCCFQSLRWPVSQPTEVGTKISGLSWSQECGSFFLLCLLLRRRKANARGAFLLLSTIALVAHKKGLTILVFKGHCSAWKLEQYKFQDFPGVRSVAPPFIFAS